MSIRQRSSFLLASVFTHVVLLGVLIVLSILAPDLLPTPRQVLAFQNADRVVQLKDIELPPPPKRVKASTVPTPPTSTDAAPLVAPPGIAPETFVETGSAVSSTVAGIEGTASGLVDGLGISESVAAPVVQPRDPVRLHSGIEAPRKIVDVAPRYPELARITRVEGIVVLEVVIDERGDVTSARVLRSLALLDDAALEAVRRWKFAPARLNGEPIPVVMTVTINFRLTK